MARIVLIHGFATGISYSTLYPALGEDAGFTAFRGDIRSKSAKAFRWALEEIASIFQTFDPAYTWRVYRTEKSMASDPRLFERLDRFFDEEEPDTIVCHSMGCFLMASYLRKQGRLSDSVRLVIFNQADIPVNGVVLTKDIESRIHSGLLTFINLHCPWDPALWLSYLFSGSIRAGLVGLNHPLIQNHFFPLTRLSNIHMAAIKSERFRQFLHRLRKELA
jgi:hypothetical protein